MRYKGGAVRKDAYLNNLTPLEHAIMHRIMSGETVKRIGKSGKRALWRIRMRLQAKTTYQAIAIYCEGRYHESHSAVRSVGR